MEERGNYKQGRNITLVGSGFNGLLILIKIGGGILGNSAAIIADGIHSFSDFISDIIVLSGLKLSSKPCDETHDFGHGKYETFASFFLGIFLLIAGFLILTKGMIEIADFIKGAPIEKPSVFVLIIALLSIMIKEYLFRVTIKVGEKTGSELIKANAWHHRTDAISSLGIFIGVSGAIVFGERFRFLDPLSAAILSVYIITISFKIIKSSFDELVESSLNTETEHKIINIIKSVKGVKSPHNLRTRRIGNRISINCHIRVSKRLNIVEAHSIATEVESRLKAEFGEDSFILIHIEPEKQ